MWEISIKRSLGKLRAPEDLFSIVEASGFRELPVTFVHADQAVLLRPGAFRLRGFFVGAPGIGSSAHHFLVPEEFQEVQRRQHLDIAP